MVSLVFWSQGFPVAQHNGPGIVTPRSHDKVALSRVEQRQMRVIILPNTLFEVHKIDVYRKGKVKVAQSCPTLQPHGTVHGNLQARILEWVAVPFSRRSSQPRD